MYLFEQQTDGTVKAVPTTAPPSPQNYNAIGLRVKDMFIYGLSSLDRQPDLIQVGANGETKNLGPIPCDNCGNSQGMLYDALTNWKGFNAGAFGEGANSDIEYVRTGQGVGNQYLYTIDYSGFDSSQAISATNTPVAHRWNLVNAPGSDGCPIVDNVTLCHNAPDLFYLDGYLWGVYTYQTGTTWHVAIYRFDVNHPTGPNGNAINVQSFSLDGIGIAAADKNGQGFGAQWVYGNGNIGLSNNANGTIYQISVTNASSSAPTFKLVDSISGPKSDGNDGTSWPGRSVDLSVVKTTLVQTTETPVGTTGNYTPGEAIVWELKIHNGGPGDSSGYTVTDTLPSTGGTGAITTTMEYASAGSGAQIGDQAGECTLDGVTLTCHGGALAAGQDVVIKVTQPTSATTASCVTNKADVASLEKDTNSDNNSTDARTCPGVLDLNKTADPAEVTKAGQTVTYTFVVKNTSPTATITNVNIAEAGADTSWNGNGTAAPPEIDHCVGPDGTTAVTNGDITLAPDESATCVSKPYTVVEADIVQGGIKNVAVATGKIGTTDVTTDDDADVKATPDPKIAVTKSVEPAGTVQVAVGQELTYTVVVTNTGNVTLTDVTVDDPNPDATPSFTGHGDPPALVGCVGPGGDNTSPWTLKPETTTTDGESVTCTYTYTVVQADIDAGGDIVNTAKGTGTPPEGDPISDDATVYNPVVDPDPSLLVTKVTDKTQVKVGDEITYTVTAENNGNVTLHDVTVSDPNPNATPSFTGHGAAPALAPTGCVWPDTAHAGVLKPTETVTCKYTYTVVQADIDAGQNIVNTALASGKPPTGDPVTDDDTADNPVVEAAPALSLTKSASTNTLALNQPVTYTFVVENTGNVTLYNVSVNDAGAYTGETVPGFSGAGAALVITCPGSPVTLAPGDTVTCTSAPYTVVQADLDRGSLDNTAVASGSTKKDMTTNDVTSAPAHKNIPGQPEPKLTLTKVADQTQVRVGDTIRYTVTAENTGNVTLHDVTVSDPNPNATPSFTGHGAAPALVGCVWPDTANIGVLKVTEKVTCTYTYTVVQADADDAAQKITNTAVATGKPPTGDPVSDDKSVDTPVLAPALTIVKTASPDPYALGVPVTFTFVVTNTGNTALTNVKVVETAFTGAATSMANLQSAITCVPATPANGAITLAKGASITCTVQYTPNQADVDAGSITNTAKATGNPPKGDPIESPESSVTIHGTSSPHLSVTKVADQTQVRVGDTITYTVTAKNTGNVTLHDVTVSDPNPNATPPFSGHGAAPALVGCVWPDTANIGVLKPTETVTCTYTYTVVQADADAAAQTIVNTAVASGKPPTGDPVTGNDKVETPVLVPALTIVKTASPATFTLGAPVTFTFVVTNTGNTTLTNVKVVETAFTGTGVGMSALQSAITCNPATPANGAITLAKDASITCTVQYTPTQADVDAGSITNTAKATGNPPKGDPIESPESPVTIHGTSSPQLTVTKVADVTQALVGQTITYTVKAQNTGNVTLREVTVVDPDPAPANGLVFSGTNGAPTLVAPGCVWPDTAHPRVLKPGQSVTCTYAYTLGTADIGSIHNPAKATGTPPNGDPVTGEDSTDTTVLKPALTIAKTATTGTFALGNAVTFKFVVKNTGNAILTNVKVVETAFTGTGMAALQSAITCDPATPANGYITLAPDASITCTVSYMPTQADVDAGSITNTAKATGVPPHGDPAHPTESEESSVTVEGTSDAQLTVTKAADVTQALVGQTITYTVKAQNTGTVTLREVTVVDPDPAPANGLVFSGTNGAPTLVAPGCVWPDTAHPRVLKPGQSVTCTYAYTLGTADIGSIHNPAKATGTPPKGDPVTGEDSTDTTVLKPALTIAKTATTDTFALGNPVTFKFVVKNTGNAILTNVKVVETAFTGTGMAGLQSAITCDPATPANGYITLAPDASITCTVQYMPTQADVDAGSITNTAKATGVPPHGDPAHPTESEESTVTVTGTSSPQLTVTKVADVTQARVGDTITYTVKAQNTGNVTLHDVTVVDPNPAPADGVVFSGTNGAPTLVAPCVWPDAAHPGVLKPGDATTVPPTPGQSVTCKYTYTLGTADVGSIHNPAKATGTPPKGDPTTGEGSTDTAVLKPALTIVKTAGTDTLVLDQPITFTFVATNTGNTTLTNVKIVETYFDGAAASMANLQSAITCNPATPANGAITLEQGRSITCTVQYTPNQADVDAGWVTNTAKATADPPKGGPIEAPPSSVNVTYAGTPQITAYKTALETNVTVGNYVHYTLTATNTGKVTLTNVQLGDIAFNGSAAGTWMTGPTACRVAGMPVLGAYLLAIPSTRPIGDLGIVLSPGQSLICELPPYKVTADDAANGYPLLNSVHAVGYTNPPSKGGTTPPPPAKVEDNAQVIVPTYVTTHTNPNKGTKAATGGTALSAGFGLLPVVLMAGSVALAVVAIRRRRNG